MSMSKSSILLLMTAMVSGASGAEQCVMRDDDVKVGQTSGGIVCVLGCLVLLAIVVTIFRCGEARGRAPMEKRAVAA